MKGHDREHLLDDIFSVESEWGASGDSLYACSLRRRRRRATRRILAVAATVVIAIGGYLSMVPEPNGSTSPDDGLVTLKIIHSDPNESPTEISDAELLASFDGRPRAIVQRPDGSMRFLLLDQGDENLGGIKRY